MYEKLKKSRDLLVFFTVPEGELFNDFLNNCVPINKGSNFSKKIDQFSRDVYEILTFNNEEVDITKIRSFLQTNLEPILVNKQEIVTEELKKRYD